MVRKNAGEICERKILFQIKKKKIKLNLRAREQRQRETRMIQPCALHCWSSHGLTTTDTHDKAMHDTFPFPIMLAAALSSFLMFAVLARIVHVAFEQISPNPCPALCF